MVFSSGRRKYQPKNKLFINNEEINITHHTKFLFLGVMVDDQLNWTDHVNYMKDKIAKGIGIISKTRKYLNINSRVCLIEGVYN